MVIGFVKPCISRVTPGESRLKPLLASNVETGELRAIRAVAGPLPLRTAPITCRVQPAMQIGQVAWGASLAEKNTDKILDKTEGYMASFAPGFR